jgi:hypothetical protein
MREQGKEMLEPFALVCIAEGAKLMEPTIGLEPMTC